MTDVYTTGTWKPNRGDEEAFVEAWSDFARWASGMPGAGTVRLARDLRDPERFVSFAAWESIDAVRAWKSSPEFKERMSRVQVHVDRFAPTELEVVAALERA
jgi:heme-degrading monooxygenase HmoA